MTIYYTSFVEAAIDGYIDTVNSNCALPNAMGTITYDVKQKATNEEFWFAIKPPIEGWGNNGAHFTQDEMIAGVDMTDITEQERNESWFTIDEEG